MRLRRAVLLLLVAFPSLLLCQSQTIDFENLAGPSVFSGIAPPLQALSATISGGQILRNTTFLPIDQTTVYGTANFCPGCLSTITIHFAQGISNFSVFVINGNTVTVTYTVADDKGGVKTLTTVANFLSGAGTVSLPDQNITTVTVSAGPAPGGCCAWDFFIDNITFKPAAPVLLDPISSTPSLLSGAVVTSNAALLATGGTVVQGVAADGTTQVVLRIPANQVGEYLVISVLDDQDHPSASTQHDGTIGGVGTVPSGGPVSFSTTAVGTTNGPMAFVIYRAPIDFIRSSLDEPDSQRQVTIHIISADFPTFVLNAPVTIRRPPVVLIHGIWDDTSTWNDFTPLLSDPRFFVRRVGYSSLVTGATASTPTYDADTLNTIRQNALGFSYNAPGVLTQIKSFINDYKNSLNIASVQADVVAHSMGGDITRSLRSVGSFLSSDTFGSGSVHKLITIGTPHLGTPLAGKLLQNVNVCTRQILTDHGKRIFSAVTISSATFSGAVGDLQGDGSGGGLSGPLSAINLVSPVHSIPTALIAGVMTNANLAGLSCSSRISCLFNPADYIRRTCPNDPLAVALTETGWPNVVGQSSDGIVPLNSQFAGGLRGTQFSGVIHSGGVSKLGFTEPDELNNSGSSSGIPPAVITLLNTTILDSSFHPL